MLIRFDGWSAMYDYWTDLNNEDLLPCGFMNYWKAKTGSKSYSFNSMTRFDKPKNYPKSFDWKEYLKENFYHSIPLEFFNDVKLNSY